MQENFDNNDFSSALELGRQELEAMEAPGWWTAGGVIVGATVVSAVGVSTGVAVSIIT